MDCFKAEQLKRVAIAQNNPRFWSRLRLIYSSVSVVNNKAKLDLVLNAPEIFLDQSILDDFHRPMLTRANDCGLDDIDANISEIPYRVYKFDNHKINRSYLVEVFTGEAEDLELESYVFQKDPRLNSIL